jgi:hypothetical protein
VHVRWVGRDRTRGRVVGQRAVPGSARSVNVGSKQGARKHGVGGARAVGGAWGWLGWLVAWSR